MEVEVNFCGVYLIVSGLGLSFVPSWMKDIGAEVLDEESFT